MPSDIEFGPAGAIVIGGFSSSMGLPTVEPFQAAYGGGSGDGFIAQFSPARVDVEQNDVSADDDGAGVVGYGSVQRSTADRRPAASKRAARR